MNNLAKDLQDIVYNYTHQLNFSECVKEINEIEYSININRDGAEYSARKYNNGEITRSVMGPVGYYRSRYALTLYVNENLKICFDQMILCEGDSDTDEYKETVLRVYFRYHDERKLREKRYKKIEDEEDKIYYEEEKYYKYSARKGNRKRKNKK